MAIVKASITLKRLRDLAPRALQIIERNKDAHIGIAIVGVALVHAAEAYIKAYDETVRYDAIKQVEMSAGRTSLVELETLIRSGLAILRHLVPSFEAPSLRGTLDTPERLISDGRKVLELFIQAGSQVSQGEAMVYALTAAIEKSEHSWAKAQASRVELQSYQGIVRAHALSLNHALIALRRILRATLGTRHLDFQMLRVSRVSPANDDESVVDEGAPLAETQPLQAAAQ